MLAAVGVFTTLARMIAFGTAGTHATTIGGWTPGLRALVGGQVLHCGCLAGIYQTYFGEVAAIVDAASEDCRLGHAANHVLERSAEGVLHGP